MLAKVNIMRETEIKEHIGEYPFSSKLLEHFFKFKKRLILKCLKIFIKIY